MFSVEEYKIALQQPLSETQIQMLSLNYAAPDMAITGIQMARGMGWGNFGAANMHYGKLGRLIAKRIGKQIEPASDGEVYPLNVLAEFVGGAGHLEWWLWENLAVALEELELVDFGSNIFPEDVSREESLLEGTTYTVTVNVFERNPIARKICIEHHGSSCSICQFNFGEAYSNMEGFIHVHHLRLLSEIREEYIIDPIKDLRPVCPNCHAVIHSKRPAYSIEEVRAMLKRGSL